MRDMYVVVFRREWDGIETCDHETNIYSSKEHAEKVAADKFDWYLSMLDRKHVNCRKHDSLPFHVVINDDTIAGYVLGKIEMCI